MSTTKTIPPPSATKTSSSVLSTSSTCSHTPNDLLLSTALKSEVASLLNSKCCSSPNLPSPPASEPYSDGDGILISESPAKCEVVFWIQELSLFQADKEILQSSEWLNDGIIFAA